jgi:1-acyl-sn-glycerol-3-phosphate acyltransferase
VILVGNHMHIIDPPLVAASTQRQVHPMAKRELFEIPMVGWIFWWLGAFPVRRFSGDMGALRAALGYLRRDEIVLMFPEGTRSRTGGLQAALPGAAMVALLAHAPVVPVALTGSNVRMPGIFLAWLGRRRPVIRVVFGEPIDVQDASADATAAEAATDLIMRRIASMLPEEMRGAYAESSAGSIVVRRQPVAPATTER